MSLFKTDGDFTLKWPIGKARKSFPIAGDLVTYQIEQDYMQLRSSYTAAAINATHYAAMGSASPTDGGDAGDSAAYLVEIGPHSDIGRGVIQWTERYCTKPAARDEWESYAYNFIGYYGVWGINVVAITGRPRFTQTVLSRLELNESSVPT